jgi:outer membrane lipoprotein-sorting protein
MKRFLMWSFERGSVQYDVICVVILAFIFLIPPSAFNDRPDSSRLPDEQQTQQPVRPISEYDGHSAFATRISAQSQGSLTLDQVLSKMDGVAKTFRSVTADLERTKVTVIVNDKDVSSGKFYYVRHGNEPRVKLELVKPLPQYVLVDKGKIQLYTPNLKQVQEAALGSNKQIVEMFMALGFGQSSEELQKNFDVTLAGDDVVDGKKTTMLDLKPKKSGTLKTIRMWLDQQRWISIQLKATEPSNDYMLFKYTNVKLNPEISDSVFELKMPKDVHIVKM